MSQLSRAVEQRHDKRPILSDLRESGSIEQDADLVIFIYRDEYYNEESDQQGLAEVICAKHRNGPTGTEKLSFLKRYAKFADLAASAEPAEGTLPAEVCGQPRPEARCSRPAASAGSTSLRAHARLRRQLLAHYPRARDRHRRRAVGRRGQGQDRRPARPALRPRLPLPGRPERRPHDHRRRRDVQVPAHALGDPLGQGVRARRRLRRSTRRSSSRSSTTSRRAASRPSPSASRATRT